MNPGTTLKELINAIEKGDKENLKEKVNEFHLKRKKLCQPYTSTSQCFTQTDLILAACRNKQADILHYLLNESDILDHLPGADYNDTAVQRQRTEAFQHALIWDAFPMVEMLYDYWSGDLHWIGHDINKIKTLRKLLDDARDICVIETQQLIIDVHSLIVFNDFQQELYSSISKTTPRDTASMLEEMLRIYDEYSKIEKVRLRNNNYGQEIALQAVLNDTTSEYMKGIQAYLKYEFYFRKLDFNVALLILDNLFVLRKVLKERFDKPKTFFAAYPDLKTSYEDADNLYKNIECALFHFIYCTYEDWRLYLPKNRHIEKKEKKGYDNGRIIFPIIITTDKHKLHNGPVLFLERKNFKKCVNDLKDLLQTHIQSVDPFIAWAQTQTKVGQASKNKEKKDYFLDNNYLTATMYMNDYYSLSKIVYYIQAIENTHGNNNLMIERILQVTGEMLKSTKHTYHLSESTKSLLQIPIDTVKYLCEIRTFLSKAGGGQLSTRMHIAKNQDQVFDDIKKDLEIIGKIINSVLDVYKHILDKSLLEHGLALLDEQIKNKSLQNIDVIDQRYAKHGDKLIEAETCEPLLQQISDDTGLTVQILKEIIWIRVNKEIILPKIEFAKKKISEWINSVLPNYIGNIRETLKLISKDYNNSKFDVHWEAIINVLTFFYDKCELLRPKPQIKKDVHYITTLLDDLENQWGSSSQCKHAFIGIEKLHVIAKQKKQNSPPRDELLTCFVSRVKQLKVILQYQQFISLEEHMRTYKRDKTFRFELEMIVADIANILAHCNKTSDQDQIKQITKKSDKLLREIDLRNLMNHGNPFLDVIADALDSYDLSTALLSKAIMFADDGESIEALFDLFQDTVNYDTIKNGMLLNMTASQKILYNIFKKSPNWESYVELFPK